MINETGDGKEIAEWFETFLKVVCWEYGLEPLVPYHDLASQVVQCLTPERKDIAKNLPWRKRQDDTAGGE